MTECRNIYNMDHPILGEISLVKVKIKTWRMHQIRIHLASAGFPVIWDIVYGNRAINGNLHRKTKINRQLLHCYNYSFKNLSSRKTLVFQSNFPEDFQKIIWFTPKNI
jgi:23S rRNA-/tRNA-specific pseudouridylate synthase